MPTARSSLVALDATPYYHCIGRCVRRAFLCGYDKFTDRSFEHRRDWVVARLAKLSRVFALDVCAYAIMSNHYHLVLKVNTNIAQCWPDDEVLQRWSELFIGPMLLQRYLNNEPLSSVELSVIEKLTQKYRSRLADLSWFMRCLNEPIARMANAEDNCTGRFWEGRFKSQALLDEKALISCMAYVDLNPIRARISEIPELSNFTSIQQRIAQSRSSIDDKQPNTLLDKEIPRLLGLSGKLDDNQSLPCTFIDYLALVDWSGRAIHPDKHGKIDDEMPSILERLDIDPIHFLKYLSSKEQGFIHVIGSRQAIQAAARKLGRKFLKGLSAANRLFPQHI